eukprot:4052121-Prymnesium_polylepis.2
MNHRQPSPITWKREPQNSPRTRAGVRVSRQASNQHPIGPGVVRSTLYPTSDVYGFCGQGAVARGRHASGRARSDYRSTVCAKYWTVVPAWSVVRGRLRFRKL